MGAVKEQWLTEYYEWVQLGVKNGFCTPVFCNTHEGDPYMSEEEMKDWDEGGDPCCFVVKLIPEH